jgi:hypothetical protein
MGSENGRFALLSRRGRATACLAALFALALPAASEPREIERISLVGPRSSFFKAAAESAVTRALERLSSSRCQQVFSDFRDASGRTLRSNLDAKGYTGAGFLEILRIANGERSRPCQSARVLAATAPNSHVIFLCGPQFFERQRRDPEFSAALVIHEMLHSLGLGENPPSSNDITAQVLARCGR